MARPSVPDHVARNAIVLDDVKLVYVPIPRAGSTSILWALAAAGGMSEERITRSPKPEVTRALTVHDLSRWGGERRLSARSASEQRKILASDDWLRFTVVREPVRRIWSAWVAKLLLHEPRFVAEFASEEWFPALCDRAEEVVDAFRDFIRALGARPGAMYSQHWASQAELAGVDDLDYQVVGRLEDLPGTLAPIEDRLRQHGRPPLAFRRENATLVPYARGLFDEEARGVCTAWTAHDALTFGYPTLRAAPPVDQRWIADVGLLLPAVRAVVERNQRIGDLSALLRRSRAS